MVLVVTEHFTRWKNLIAISDGTAETLTKVLDQQMFGYFGLSEKIHSDQGAQFESKLMKELCQLGESKKFRHHPQGNSMVREEIGIWKMH